MGVPDLDLTFDLAVVNITSNQYTYHVTRSYFLRHRLEKNLKVKVTAAICERSNQDYTMMLCTITSQPIYLRSFNFQHITVSETLPSRALKIKVTTSRSKAIKVRKHQINKQILQMCFMTFFGSLYGNMDLFYIYILHKKVQNKPL